jgi:hypothetical protein
MIMQNRRSLRNVEFRREMERTLILAALVTWTWPVLAADLPIISRDNQDDEPATIRMTLRRRRGDEGRA